MDPLPTRGDVRLLWDYVFFHLHSPLNSAQDDYRHFNHVLFNAFKLNFFYTTALYVGYYQIFFSSKRGILRGFVSPHKGLLFLFGYSFLQYCSRVRCTLYRPEAIECAQRYEKDVDKFNDYHHRMYGNE